MILSILNRFRRRLPTGLSKICKRACWVALIVGTVLNVINQGDALVHGDAINFVKVILTYMVPFAVSTHGALSASGRASAPADGSGGDCAMNSGESTGD